MTAGASSSATMDSNGVGYHDSLPGRLSQLTATTPTSTGIHLTNLWAQPDGS